MGLTDAPVTSPTFVMVQEYEPNEKPVKSTANLPTLIHLDAYRLKSLEDLESIGWDLDAAELRQGAVVVVEWADRLTDLLGQDLTVELHHLDECQRSISINAADRWMARMGSLIAKFEKAH